MKKLLDLTKNQLTLFFYALSYFTRLPIPNFVVFDNEQFHKANAYLPVVGFIAALLMAMIFYLCQLIFSVPVSIILMLIASLLLTGALHEDGFADCCDGFGGGYDVEQRLKIMKDSQIGTYGGIGLIVVFLLKFNLLTELAEVGGETLFIGLLVAHSISRYAALYIMQTMDYVRLQKGSKVQSLAKKLDAKYFIFASLCAFVSLLCLNFNSAVLVIILVVIITLILGKLFAKELGGYTGDCLGCTQQCIEVTILLLLTTGIT